MAVPLRLVPMSPLYNTGAGFTIGTIHSFRPVFGMQNCYLHPNGYPVNKVEVFAVVTEKAVKEKYVKFTLDDGTGCIQCFHNRTETNEKHGDDPESVKRENAIKDIEVALQKEHRKNSAMKGEPSDAKADMTARFLRSLVKHAYRRIEAVKLGDILIAEGCLRPWKWGDSVMLSCDRYSVLSDDPHVLDTWLTWVRDAHDLQKMLCSERGFVPEEINIAIEKAALVSNLSNDLGRKLPDAFQSYIFAADSICTQFYGYEVFEFPAVSKVLDDVFAGLVAPAGKRLPLTAKESREVKFKAIVKVLHTFIVDGKIFKRKGFYHTRITGADQLDALYFVTSNCKRLRDIVSAGKCTQYDMDTLREIVAASEYYFVLESKHFPAVMNCLLQETCDSDTLGSLH